MRRGILGGTFDPPHLAHLVAAETTYRQLGVDVVTLIPAGAPWQKEGRTVTEAHHRLAMAKLAVAGIRYLEVDDREVRRPGPTYTIDTVASFEPGDDIVLILGADAAAGLPTWHRAVELRSRVDFAVMPRPGAGVGAAEAGLRPAAAIWLDTPELGISATALRRRVADGGSIRFLVPDPVWEYVEDHRLYAPGP